MGKSLGVGKSRLVMTKTPGEAGLRRTTNPGRISLERGDGNVLTLNSGVGCTTLNVLTTTRLNTLKRHILRYMDCIFLASTRAQVAGGWS